MLLTIATIGKTKVLKIKKAGRKYLPAFFISA
jgi:hypothetical protein